MLPIFLLNSFIGMYHRSAYTNWAKSHSNLRKHIFYSFNIIIGGIEIHTKPRYTIT